MQRSRKKIRAAAKVSNFLNLVQRKILMETFVEESSDD